MAHPLIQKAQQERRSLLEHEAIELLKAHDLPVSPALLASSSDDAVKKAKEIGYPVVLKIVSPQIIHKSDVGGVKVNLKSAEEVDVAYREIIDNALVHDSDAEIKGVLVTPMAQAGTEIIIGMIRDPQFGSCVMFGLGGIFVEVFKDVTFRVAPISSDDAREMIEETKSYTVLKGVRGKKPKDVEALVNIITKVSQLAIQEPDIKEIDLNPVLVYEKGVALVDARVLL